MGNPSFSFEDDIEQFNWMMEKSKTAREVVAKFKEADLYKGMLLFAKLVKIGYDEKQIASFVHVLLEQETNWAAHFYDPVTLEYKKGNT